MSGTKILMGSFLLLLIILSGSVVVQYFGEHMEPPPTEPGHVPILANETILWCTFPYEGMPMEDYLCKERP